MGHRQGGELGGPEGRAHPQAPPGHGGGFGQTGAEMLHGPMGPGCVWKCSIEGCNMGLKDAGSSGQHRHHVRMQHRATDHPDAAKDLFYLPGDATNVAKASVACSNRGAAARVLGLGLARRGGHDPVWLSYPIPPPVGERKKAWKETLVHRIFCKDCCNLVRTADDLAARDCVPGYVVPTVRKMLRRIKARLEEKNVAEHIAKAARGDGLCA